MTSPITPADRAAAEKALRDLWFECGKKPRDPNGGVDVVAAAIADARDAENRACEAVALADQIGFGNRDGASGQVARKIAARRSR